VAKAQLLVSFVFKGLNMEISQNQDSQIKKLKFGWGDGARSLSKGS
jgi:hypothetical protein